MSSLLIVLVILILLLYIKWVVYILALPVIMFWYDWRKNKFISSLGKEENSLSIFRIYQVSRFCYRFYSFKYYSVFCI